MLDAAAKQFGNDRSVAIVDHDFDNKLPPMGQFDAVISAFAIHHLAHGRKRELYKEIFKIIALGGVFCNLEHVASPTAELHAGFLRALRSTPEEEDRSNKLLALETQLGWLREIGFHNVDCQWKWRELALLTGTKPR
jgi:SAM-dependent methyltransferase